MSQIPLNNDERIAALQRFGYSDREAPFLCVAALHGGYFLRRQYGQFLARQDGGNVAQLVEKTLAQNHARAFTFRGGINIYHLCARPFYEVLGQPDNRNRRERQPLTIKNKLMGLDFVLAHPGQYLATEQEKLDYFTGTLQIQASLLPTKLYHGAKTHDRTTRYFVDKYPVYLSAPGAVGAPAVVSFCYVDEGMTTLSRFDTYLAQYAMLFRALGQFQLTYVASTARFFEAAEMRFERFLTHGSGGRTSSLSEPESRRRLEYFALRRAYETRQLTGFDRAKLIRLRDGREAFSGERNEALYERWKASGDPAVLAVLPSESVMPAGRCATFSTYLLKHDYELFGSLTAY